MIRRGRVRVADDPFLRDRRPRAAAIGSGDSMAHILEFRSNAARVMPECDDAPSGGAQIIIFPGVRIERHGQSEEAQTKARRRERGRPKRDRLELLD